MKTLPRLMLLALLFLLLAGLTSCRLMMDIPDGPPVPAECGNGAQEGDEDCDGLDLGGKTCSDVGYLAGALSCSADCTFNTGLCFNTDPCGDGQVLAGVEDCDGEDLDGATCESLGFSAGTLACTIGCVFDTSACAGSTSCGNGVIDDESETCDLDDLGDAPPTCETLGYHGGGAVVCGANCLFDDSGCIAVCGDGNLEPGEACDPGMRPSPGCSVDCQVNPGWECQGEPSQCTSLCGDGIITSAEDCEGADLNGQTCLSYGVGYGPLSCGDGCLFDTSACRQILAVSAGDRHTCAVLSSGAAYCWGAGASGQLGTGLATDSNVPEAVSGGLTFTGISAGGLSTCATSMVSMIQGLHCWGDNARGQLGTNNTLPSLVPVPVVNLPEDSSTLYVTTGSNFACAFFMDGTGYCWGDNESGQLGTGNQINYRAPRAVKNIMFFEDLSAGLDHTCAIADASLYCWGANDFGQLGIGGSSIPQNEAQFVSITNGPRQVSAGSQFTCAVNYSGQVYCWGRNTYGQLGDGTTTSRNIPTLVSGLTNVSAVSAGGDFACAVLTTGELRCWGRNSSGQLGNNTSLDSSTPLAVSNITTAVAVTVGGEHVCVLLIDGTLRCWGSNASGQLGAGQVGGAFDLPIHVSNF
ncbi:hypothetical protein KKD52_15440 [Myxococcota bacterium]|nr:hypothetical protein [Myxococcota bacterium]MBU1411089.1 hypothetical protein [Myxococcota bacterium]MBU1511745.1 hypothetical protein [Myxococcota bacterium]